MDVSRAYHFAFLGTFILVGLYSSSNTSFQRTTLVSVTIMATTTDKEVPPDEIIDLMISKLQKIRDNLNTTDLGRHRFKIIRLSDAIDALYEEFSPTNDPASKPHNSMQFTLVERPKSRVLPPVVAENGPGGVTQESESKDKKHGLDNAEEGRKLKKPRKYKRLVSEQNPN